MHNTSMLRSLYWGMIIVQIAAVAALVVYIRDEHTTYVSAPLPENTYSFRSSGSLEHYFEPAATPGGRIENTIVTDDWIGPKPRYLVNSEGMNSAREYSIEKPEGTFRVVVLGDSWTWGYLVNTEDNYSSQLERILNENSSCRGTHFEVLNLGVPSYDLAYSAERFRTRGTKFDPDAVIWFIRHDDFEEPNELIKERMAFHMEEMEQTDEHPNFVFTLGIGYVDDRNAAPTFSDQYYNRQIAARMRARLDVQELWGINGMIEYANSILREFNTTYDGPLIIPRERLALLPSEVERQMQASIRQYAIERPLTHTFTFRTDIQEDGLHLFDFHPNERGHRFLAQELFEILVNTQVVPCTP